MNYYPKMMNYHHLQEVVTNYLPVEERLQVEVVPLLAVVLMHLPRRNLLLHLQHYSQRNLQRNLPLMMRR
jgi:hypothetical protein